MTQFIIAIAMLIAIINTDCFAGDPTQAPANNARAVITDSLGIITDSRFLDGSTVRGITVVGRLKDGYPKVDSNNNVVILFEGETMDILITPESKIREHTISLTTGYRWPKNRSADEREVAVEELTWINSAGSYRWLGIMGLCVFRDGHIIIQSADLMGGRR